MSARTVFARLNRRAFFRAAAVLLFLPAAVCSQQDAALDEFIQQTMKTWSVPGAAVAIVKDGKVIHAKGYGLRDVKNNLPVTTRTLFAIGSSSKSFTVLSLGVLVDDGKLEWDKPVREYLPDFRLWDRTATEQMTARDLVTHRSGLPRHDLMWYSSPYSREQMFQRLRHLEPSADFRSTWQYQNLMYMTAGYLAGRLAGKSWEQVVSERLFAPLGMTASNFSVEVMRRSPDAAKPYRKVKEEVNEIPYRNIDEIGPAGSINSNVEEMARYVIMHLDGGKFEGKQVVGANVIREMHTPQMVVGAPVRWEELGHQSYGLGVFINGYRGRKLVHHGGNIDGFSALFSMIPSEKLGVVILTNLNGSPAPTVISYGIFDRIFGLPPIDWSARLKEDEARMKAAEEEAEKRKITPQKAGTQPSHPIAEYGGEYEHPAYGVLTISEQGGTLAFEFHGIRGTLKHFHYDVFEVAATPGLSLDKTKVQFHSNLQGDLDRAALLLEPSVKPIEFLRRAERRMFERSFLQPFTGTYQLGPQQVVIALRGDQTLVMSTGGQSPVELVPARGTQFLMKGRTGFSVEFRTGEGGAPDLVIYQPNGTFVAKRAP
jgi:CubicO group peptidase (beta-lactamase class C family)